MSWLLILKKHLLGRSHPDSGLQSADKWIHAGDNGKEDSEEFVEDFCDLLLKLKTHGFKAKVHKLFYNELFKLSEGRESACKRTSRKIRALLSKMKLKALPMNECTSHL